MVSLEELQAAGEIYDRIVKERKENRKMYLVYKDTDEGRYLISVLADDSSWSSFEEQEDAYTWAKKMDALDERNKRLEPDDGIIEQGVQDG